MFLVRWIFRKDKKSRRALLSLLGIVPAVISLIVFILTENMTNTMRMVDKWTLLMLILFVIVLLLIIFLFRKKDDDEEEEEEIPEDETASAAGE